MDKRTCYEILGLTEDATTDEVKSAFYKLAQLYHPDHNSTELGLRRYYQIVDAYNRIKRNDFEENTNGSDNWKNVIPADVWIYDSNPFGRYYNFFNLINIQYTQDPEDILKAIDTKVRYLKESNVDRQLLIWHLEMRNVAIKIFSRPNNYIPYFAVTANNLGLYSGFTDYFKFHGLKPNSSEKKIRHYVQKIKGEFEKFDDTYSKSWLLAAKEIELYWLNSASRKKYIKQFCAKKGLSKKAKIGLAIAFIILLVVGGIAGLMYYLFAKK